MFDIVAKMTLSGPTNLNQIKSQIHQSLGNIKGKISLTIPNGLITQLDTISQSLKNISINLHNVSAAGNVVKNVLHGVGSSVGNAQGQVANLNTVVQQTTTSLTKAGKEAKFTAEHMLDFSGKASLAFKRFLAFSLTAGPVIAVFSRLRSGVRDAVSFQREMVRLAQVSETSLKTVSRVGDEVFRLAKRLGVSSSELAKTAVIIKQAGFNINETTAALEGLSLAALAPNFGSLEDTSKGLIAIIRQFNLSVYDTTQILGSVNKVASEFAVEADDIIEAVKRGGSTFALAGGKLEEFVALFTAVRDTTQESADAIGTAFKVIFQRFQRPEVIDDLKLIGINLRRTREEAIKLGDERLENTFVGPYEAVRRLNTGLNQLRAIYGEGFTASPEFARVAENLGGLREINRIIPLVTQFEKAERALAKAQEGRNSLVKDATTAQEAYAVQLTRIGETVKETIHVFSENSGIRAFLTLLEQTVGAFSKLVKTIEPLTPLLLLYGVGKAGGFAKRTILGRAEGGVVPGSGNRDSIPAMLTPGEFVLRKASAERIGYGNLAKWNAYGQGGIVHANKGIILDQYGNPIEPHKYAGIDVLTKEKVGRKTFTPSAKFAAQQANVTNTTGKNIVVPTPGVAGYDVNQAVNSPIFIATASKPPGIVVPQSDTSGKGPITVVSGNKPIMPVANNKPYNAPPNIYGFAAPYVAGGPKPKTSGSVKVGSPGQPLASTFQPATIPLVNTSSPTGKDLFTLAAQERAAEVRARVGGKKGRADLAQSIRGPSLRNAVNEVVGSLDSKKILEAAKQGTIGRTGQISVDAVAKVLDERAKVIAKGIKSSNKLISTEDALAKGYEQAAVELKTRKKDLDYGGIAAQTGFAGGVATGRIEKIKARGRLLLGNTVSGLRNIGRNPLALGTAALGTQYLADRIGANNVDDEGRPKSATTAGVLGSVTTGLTGAAAGAAVGGPVGAFVGLGIGAIIGFTQEIKKAEAAIADFDLKQAEKKFLDFTNNITRDSIVTSRELGDINSQISDVLSRAEAQENIAIKKSLDDNVGTFTKLKYAVQYPFRSKEALASDLAASDAGITAQGAGSDARKRALDPSKSAITSALQQYIVVNTKNRSPDEILKEIQDVFPRLREIGISTDDLISAIDKVSSSLENAEGFQAINKVTLQFSSLATTLQIANSRFELFSSGLNRASDLLEGNLSVTRFGLSSGISKIGTGSPEFDKALEDITQPLGGAGKQLVDFTKQIDFIQKELPGLLEQNKFIPQETRTTNVIRELKKLGITDTRIIGRVGSELNDSESKDLTQIVDFDAFVKDKFGKSFDDISKTLNDLAKELESAFTTYESGLIKFAGLQNKVNEQLNQLSSLDFTKLKFNLEQSSFSNFRNPIRDLSLKDTRLGFEANQTRLAGDIGLDSEAISERISANQEELARRGPATNKDELQANKLLEIETQKLVQAQANLVSAYQLESQVIGEKINLLRQEQQARIDLNKNLLGDRNGRRDVRRGLDVLEGLQSGRLDINTLSRKQYERLNNLSRIGNVRLRGASGEFNVQDEVNKYFNKGNVNISDKFSVVGNQQEEANKLIGRQNEIFDFQKKALEDSIQLNNDASNKFFKDLNDGFKKVFADISDRISSTKGFRIQDVIGDIVNDISKQIRTTTSKDLPRIQELTEFSDLMKDRPNFEFKPDENPGLLDILDFDRSKKINRFRDLSSKFKQEFSGLWGRDRTPEEESRFQELSKFGVLDLINEPVNKASEERQKLEKELAEIKAEEQKNPNDFFIRLRKVGIEDRIKEIRAKRFSTGGQARGTDTVPAMLTPGEFVVNSQSTKYNYNLLEEINQARGPVYFARGGRLRDRLAKASPELKGDAFSNNLAARTIVRYSKNPFLARYIGAKEAKRFGADVTKELGFERARFGGAAFQDVPVRRASGGLVPNIRYYQSGGRVGVADASSRPSPEPKTAERNLDQKYYNHETAIQGSADFVSAISKFNTIISGSFVPAANKLGEAMSKFPKTIEITAKHDVNVIINGAEVLARLEPTVKELVIAQVSKSMNQMIADKFPELGRISR